MKSITLKQKVFGEVTVIILLMLAIGIVTYYGMNNINANYKKTISKEYEQALTMLQIELAATKQEYFITKSISFASSADVKKYENAVNDMNQKLANLSRIVEEKDKNIETIKIEAKKFQETTLKAQKALNIEKDESKALDILTGELGEISARQTTLLAQLSKEAINNAKQKVEETDIVADKTIYWISLLLVIATVLIIVISLFILQSITNPLSKIAVLTNLLANGNLNVQINEAEENTEFGALINSFKNLVEGLQKLTFSIENIAKGYLRVEILPRSEQDTLALALKDMVKSLYSIVSKVQISSEKVKEINLSMNLIELSKQLEKDNEKVSNSVQDMVSVVEELSANTNAISRSIDTQASSVVQTNISIQEMAKRLQQITANTKNLTQVVDNTNVLVKEGKQKVEQASNGMKQINSSIVETSETMEKLDKQAAAIGRILEVINNISEQTNLLALNAAIEAARAGSHGLGFGVVAEEVRKLSERTASSAEEISQLITGVQKAVTQVAKKMGRSTELVNEGITQSNDVVNTLVQIEKVVGIVSSSSIDINRIIVEQSMGIEEILKTTQELTIITGEIQSAGQEQAISTDEMVKVVTNVQESVERNSKLSEHLSLTGKAVLSELQQLEQAISIFQFSSSEDQYILRTPKVC